MQGIWTIILFRSRAFFLTTIKGLLIHILTWRHWGPKTGCCPVLDLRSDHNAYAQGGGWQPLWTLYVSFVSIDQEQSLVGCYWTLSLRVI
jgi:hypothetical protein